MDSLRRLLRRADSTSWCLSIFREKTASIICRAVTCAEQRARVFSLILLLNRLAPSRLMMITARVCAARASPWAPAAPGRSRRRSQVRKRPIAAFAQDLKVVTACRERSRALRSPPAAGPSALAVRRDARGRQSLDSKKWQQQRRWRCARSHAPHHSSGTHGHGDAALLS